MRTYDVGDAVRLTATFTNSAGAAVDPSGVTFRYRMPTDATSLLTYGVDVALVKDTVGNYHVDLTVNSSGVWGYRWAGTGEYASAEEGMFQVRFSSIL